jgi:type IV pilus secretin PilQ/predicted competence protein
MRRDERAQAWVRAGVLSLLLFVAGPAAARAEGLYTDVPPPDEQVSLNLDGAPLLDALKLLVAPRGLNLVLGEGVTGTVRVQLNGVSFEEALHAVLTVNKLSFFQQGQTLYVFRDDEAAEIAPDLLDRRIEAFPINYVPLGEISTIVEPFLSAAGRYMVSPTTSTLVIEDVPSRVAEIADLIEALDVPPQQVLIQAQIVDVTLDDETSLGVQWDYLKAKDVVSDATGMEATATLRTDGFSPTVNDGIFFSFATSGFKAFLDALEQKTRTEVLASPTVLALDGKEAEIIIGSKLGFRLLTTSPTGLVMETIEFLDVGTQLTLTPHIGDDGLIILEIHPEVSDGVIDQGLPSETTTEATTSLIVQDGTTILVGGLMRHRDEETRSQVPILGSIPLLGRLFQKSTTTRLKSEVVVAITPHIVNPQGSGFMDRGLGRIQDTRDRFGLGPVEGATPEE